MGARSRVSAPRVHVRVSARGREFISRKKPLTGGGGAFRISALVIGKKQTTVTFIHSLDFHGRYRRREIPPLRNETLTLSGYFLCLDFNA